MDASFSSHIPPPPPLLPNLLSAPKGPAGYQSFLALYKKLIDTESYTGKILEKDGVKAFLNYLNQPQPYKIVTTAADWGFLEKDSFVLGKLGNHALIVLTGNRICEWSPAPTNLGEKKVSQEELRVIAKGKAVEEMWQMHLEMYKEYNQLGNIFDKEKRGYIHYMPFFNDCFNYVDIILKKAGEAPTKLERTKGFITEVWEKSIIDQKDKILKDLKSIKISWPKF